MDMEWQDGFRIKVRLADGAAVISANQEGLLSLAAQLASLARETPGSHVHYDKDNSLEEDSAEMIIEKTE
ncbi:MAG: hypothetical protein IIZ45_00930 [Firmicutes bacterium]|nr:hypothetical protein [Bacillota bacterium]